MDAWSIASALTGAAASGFGSAAGKALWERVKGKVLRDKPDGAVFLDYLGRSPEQMVEPLRLLLEDVRAGEDEAIAELATTVLLEVKIEQSARAKVALQAGRDIKSVYQADNGSH